MIIELIRKEYLQGRNRVSDKLYVNILFLLAKALFYSLFVALEVFLFVTLDKKINEYSSEGSFDFLLLLCFIIFLISVVFGLMKARKSFFDQSDLRVICPLPIQSGDIVVAKVIYVYFEIAFANLFAATPLLITYGALNGYIPYYYIFSALYPFFIAFFGIGAVMLLVSPFQYLYGLVQKSDLLQLGLGALLMIALCFAYQYVLELFLVALSDSSLGGVFSPGFIDGIHNVAKYLFPTSMFLNAVVKAYNILPGLLISIGSTLVVLIAGYFVASASYAKLNQANAIENRKRKETKQKERKLRSTSKALLKKEFDIIFRDSSNIFSYSALLIMLPFLSFVVITSLNKIAYQNLKMLVLHMSELVNGINIVLILLFFCAINLSASFAMSREGKNLVIVKTIPVKPLRQIMIKISIPSIFSAASLLFTSLLLLATSTIDFKTCLIASLIGILLIVSSNFLGVYLDMYDLSDSKFKLKWLAGAYAFLLPLFILALHLIMSFSFVPYWAIYLVEVGIVLALSLGIVAFVSLKAKRAFRRMEAR
ncbi:MAG: hypothetical protein ACI32C_02735 [Candidatus Enteromonas sp.]